VLYRIRGSIRILAENSFSGKPQSQVQLELRTKLIKLIKSSKELEWQKDKDFNKQRAREREISYWMNLMNQGENEDNVQGTRKL
jgi:hypothetical protein